MSKDRRKSERRTYVPRRDGFGGWLDPFGYNNFENRHSRGKNDRRRKK